MKNLFCYIVALTLLVGCNSGGEDSKSATDKTGDKTEKVADKRETLKSQQEDATTNVEQSSEPTQAETTPSKKSSKPERDENNPEFHEALLSAANDYLKYGLVNVQSIASPQLAIADCAPAFDPEPAPTQSKSDDESTHGQKLYFLFAKDIGNYVNLQSEKEVPVGQTIVKEAWESKEGNPDARNLRSHASGHPISPRIKVGDKTLEITRRKNLFIMLKMEPETKGTDNGWVYGIVTPDEKKVIASGNVASCATCHANANLDRLFGVEMEPLEFEGEQE